MDALNRPTALVTGSSSGIGRALAERLAAEGWRVFVHGRNAERLQATLLSLDGNGHEVFRADMADLDAVRQLAADVEAASDRLDVLVHNAGVLPAERQTIRVGTAPAPTVGRTPVATLAAVDGLVDRIALRTAFGSQETTSPSVRAVGRSTPVARDARGRLQVAAPPAGWFNAT